MDRGFAVGHFGFPALPRRGERHTASDRSVWEFALTGTDWWELAQHPPTEQPAVSNGQRAALVHALMGQVWDSTRDGLELDTLAVTHGILRNTELLDAIVAYRTPRYRRLIARLWESRRHWQTLHNDPWRHYTVTEIARTPQTMAAEMVSADPDHFRAGRDSEGCIRLRGGQGLAVASRNVGRAEVERWFIQATRPYFAAQYLAVLQLFDREAADITEEPTE
ncbi:hypothetical protein AB0M22_09280 [Nocardia sp. NPDC051756]|uniref:hypothetical protein n=1 Tax=Nocardia sp. NPDC051756 TaxID=3154751 RepID=UPI00342F0FF9